MPTYQYIVESVALKQQKKLGAEYQALTVFLLVWAGDWLVFVGHSDRCRCMVLCAQEALRRLTLNADNQTADPKP